MKYVYECVLCHREVPLSVGNFGDAVCEACEEQMQKEE